MKTDELIDMLSMNVEPVDRRLLTRGLGLAVALGAAGVLCATLVALGIRPDLGEAHALRSLILKLAFTLGMVVLASILLMRFARPGGEHRAHLAFVALPFAGIMILAAFNLALAPQSQWEAMIVGDMWLHCLLFIPVIAIVPFATTVWAVRRMMAAPTDLVRTGALVGLLAGGVSAAGYALYCTDDSVPFVALWYGGTIALCTLAGAMLGPRLLRW